MRKQSPIEVDIDVAFPRPGSRSGIITRPRPTGAPKLHGARGISPPSRPATETSTRPPPVRALPLPPRMPPPAPVQARSPALDQLQDDMDLVIAATSRRLDDMVGTQREFERTVRGVVGGQERRIRELEAQLGDVLHRLELMTRLTDDLADRLQRNETRAYELHARTAVALARVEAVERTAVLDNLKEPTHKIIRG